MLATLRVKNLALAENVRVEFQPGLNVITGETGAGKSILIGALDLLVGERADKKLIRAGEEACGAEALFQFSDSSAVDAVLEQFGLEPCADGQLLIRRIVKANGTNQVLVNDSPVTLQVLKQLGDILVDLHGPHDHQSLFSPDFQLDLLDSFGHLWGGRETYEEVYRVLAALEERRQTLAGGAVDVAEQMDRLAYRIKEIEEAAPGEGEEEKVQREHAVVGNAQRVLELGQGALAAMLDDDASAFNLLAGAQKRLEELARLLPEADGWREEIRQAVVRLQETAAAMHSRLDRVEADPARLEWLDQRLAVYQKLKRKYGASVAEMLELLETSRAQLKDLQTRDEQLAQLDREIAAQREKLETLGLKLRRQRADVAGQLAAGVTAELRALGFAHGAFAVTLRDAAPRASGMDTVEFGFAPNAGEPMKPLRDIASSGEISRVMLATKVTLANHDRIPILVFDEIDANVGGEIGNAIGRKLAEVARRHQVICVTHLPQVAACGAHHLAVSKSVRDNRTFTEVRALDETGRVEELARMLGGRDLTSVTLKHAREMLR